MATDMSNWRLNVENELKGLADEQFQRNVWFGQSTMWVDSPNEQFCRFFDDVDIPNFLGQANNGLNEEQEVQLTHLTKLMRKLSDETPTSVKPEELIDDPRWIAIRKQAAIVYDLLTKRR
jgi:hypothetical protein